MKHTDYHGQCQNATTIELIELNGVPDDFYKIQNFMYLWTEY